MEIRDGVIFFEVHKIPIVADQSLFYSLTKPSSQGVPFEGALVDDWKPIYSSHDAQKMVSVENADMTGCLLTGSFTIECCIMHYILCRVFLCCSTNLAQAFEEDLILLWALQTGRQID